MCKAPYFRTACSKQDLFTVIKYIDRKCLDSVYWSILSTSQQLPAFKVFPVEQSFELSAGDYLYIIFVDEKDAIDLAGKIKSGSMVLPEAGEPSFYFFMRVD